MLPLVSGIGLGEVLRANLQNSVEGVPGIWSDHQRGAGAARLDQAPQVLAPDLLTGVVDVVAVADHRHGHAGELLDDVLEGVFLVVLSPRCDGAAENKHCSVRMYERALVSQAEVKEQKKAKVAGCCCETMQTLSKRGQHTLAFNQGSYSGPV